MNKHIKNERETPPEDHEWPGIWEALEKAEKGWIITGPVHAVVTNWKALAVVAGVVAWVNRPGIMEALSTLVGVPK